MKLSTGETLNELALPGEEVKISGGATLREITPPKTPDQTFNNVSSYNPDEVAEVGRLSKKLNASPEFVRGNLDKVRTMADRS